MECVLPSFLVLFISFGAVWGWLNCREARCIGGGGSGAGVVKVRRRQSSGVKCLSCLFTVNDGFDSLPKEQWETRSGAMPWAEWGGRGHGPVMMLAVLFASERNFYTNVWRQLKPRGQFSMGTSCCCSLHLSGRGVFFPTKWSMSCRPKSVKYSIPCSPHSYPNTHPPCVGQAHWCCWWLVLD